MVEGLSEGGHFGEEIGGTDGGLGKGGAEASELLGERLVCLFQGGKAVEVSLEELGDMPVDSVEGGFPRVLGNSGPGGLCDDTRGWGGAEAVGG